MKNTLKQYSCECGKIFYSSQAFNGHKGRCAEHMKYVGKLDIFLAHNKHSCEIMAIRRKEKLASKREEALQEWKNVPHFCEKCGKVMTEKYGSGRFCSKACAKSHIISSQTKKKISEGVHRTLKALGKSRKDRHCKYCGNLIPLNRLGRYCSEECFKLGRHKSLSESISMAHSEGKGIWLPRTVWTFAETIWKDILDYNNFSYLHNYKMNRKASNLNKSTCSFADFYLEIGDKRIDLEIDGKQHRYEDRFLKDLDRDALLAAEGIYVYRVPFVNPSKEPDKFNQQVGDFLSFIHNII